MSEHKQPRGDRTTEPIVSGDQDAAPATATATAATPSTAGGNGRMWVGPTSEETRRLVAESRLRQGLPPHIDNPAVIESLALFLRNALDTLDRDQHRDRDRRAA